MIIKFQLKKNITLLMILASFVHQLLSQPVNTNHSDKISNHDIKIGESLFNGLIKDLNTQPVNCASCHNVYLIDTFNWNPSALDIAFSTHKMAFEDVKSLLIAPTSKKLTESHKDINLSNDQINQIRYFLADLKEKGVMKEKPVINKLIGFIICSLIILFSLTDLIVTKKIKQKYIHAIVLLLATGYVTNIMVRDAIALGRQQYYEPEQPIKFSHKVHATDNKIDCLYCHHTAEQSKSAGIPAMSLCLNCHAIVKEGSNSGKFEINKIDASIVSGKPVEWVRIHNLPDHVYFNHAQHVAVGKLDCKECHGPVEEMDRIYQYNDLSMGWCLDCHRSRKVQFGDNKYYNIYEKFHEDIKSGKIDSVLVKDIGGQDCQKCHY